jgi:CMP/dCMP kinase
MKDKLIIAIDGHSSCGKSTMAKALAKEINYIYIDSGAMYRVVTLFALRNDAVAGDSVDEKKMAGLMDEINITFKYNTLANQYETFLNGENVEDEIRTIKVSDNVSIISKIRFIRERMVKLQQDLGKGKGIVMDGRDIGTVVFPNADLKIFVTASADVRAMRRYKELIGKGDKVTFEEVKENIEKRDFIDQTRKESPLIKADDAIVLDNSLMTEAEQMNWLLEIVKTKL